MRILLRDLSPGTQYAIQLRSNTGSEVSEWSQVFYLTTESDTIPPAKPINVVGSMVGTSFFLKWDAVTLSTDGTAASDLDYYRVFVQSSGSASTASFVVKDTKFEFNLQRNREVFGQPQANIQMAVQAVDKAGNTAGYTTFVSQTNPAPANITGFTGTPIADGIEFKWNAVSDADLMIYRLYSGTTVGTQATLVWSGMATGVTVQSIEYGVDKWYKIAAVDVFNTESVTPPVVGPLRPNSSFAVDTTAPGVPTGLAATLANASDESYAIATVSWTAVTDTDNDLAEYIIGYRPAGATDWQYEKVDYTNTSTKINGLLPYTNYDFRIRASDWSANLSAWAVTVTATGATNAIPSTPAAPSASSGVMRIQVSHNNLKAAGGTMEGDVVRYEVYASTTTGFTPATANMLGTMASGPAIVGSWQVPAQGGAATETWYVKVIAVDRGGLKSAASAQATATPGLIINANIVDATITNAKIASLDANKITAGTGFINDLTVKSKFTLGDASTVGAIESFGYVAGTTGFRFDKNLLEINDGSISAAALKIQDSANIIAPEYASFEGTPDWYNIGVGIANLADDQIMTDGGKYGTQYLRVTFTAAAQSKFPYFTPTSSTNYNINVEEGETYIVSAYVRTSAQADAVSIRIRYSDGLYGTYSTQTITTLNQWVRIYSVFTVPAGITSGVIIMRFDSSAVGQTFDVDGVQLERKMAGQSTPSVWKPPGLTQINGGIIRTGEIRSTQNVTVNGNTQPVFSINLAGKAQFGDALIRGKLLVGQSGADVDAGQSYIASGNYVANTTGWKIDSAGNLEANTGYVRGNVLVDGTVTAEKIGLGVLRTNLVGDPSFEEEYSPTFWDFLGDHGVPARWRKTGSAPGGAQRYVGDGRSGATSMHITAGPGYDYSVLSPVFWIEAGKKYRVIVHATAVTSNAKLVIAGWGGTTQSNPADPSLGGITVNIAGIGEWFGTEVPFVSTVTPDSYQQFSGEMTTATSCWALLRIMNYQPTATSVLVVDDISVVEIGQGGASELTAAGLRLFDNEGAESGAFVTGRPNFFSISKKVNGIMENIASISDEGTAKFVDLYTDSDPIIGGFPLLGGLGDYIPPVTSGALFSGHMDKLPRGLIAYNDGGSSALTGSAWRQELSFYAEPGRSYRIKFNGCFATLSAADTFAGFYIGYATPASPGGDAAGQPTSIVMYDYNHAATAGGYTYFAPMDKVLRCNKDGIGVGGELNAGRNRMLIGFNANGQTMTPQNSWECFVEDIGLDMPDTGIANTTGTGQSSAVQTYTTTWTCNSSEAYTGANAAETWTTDLSQGYYTVNNGNQHSLMLFTGNGTSGQAVTVATAMTGATVVKAEVYIYFKHWYNNSGGSAIIRANTLTALAGTAPSGTAVTSANWPKPGGRWVDITSIWNTTHRGIWLGKGPTTSLLYYGRAAGHADSTAYKPKLRLTYRK